MGTKQQPASQSGPNAPSAKNFPEAHLALFVEIQSEWNKAEEAIKRSEHVVTDVSIPAITELRYAGRRIVDAMAFAGKDGDHSDKIKALLEDARFCCHRAQHDAIDAAMAKISIDLDNLVNKLGLEPVAKAYPPFQVFYATFALAQERVASSRGNREDRNAIYDTITEIDLPAMVRCYREVMVVRPIIKKHALSMRLGSYGVYFLGFVAVATMIFAAMAVDWNKWWPSGVPVAKATAGAAPSPLPPSSSAP